MTIPSLKYTLLTACLTLSLAAFAQDKKDPKVPSATTPEKTQEPQKGNIAEEIEVVRPYKPILAEAVKLRRNPTLDDNKPFKPQLTYNITGKKLELNANIAQLKAQKLAAEQVDTLTNNYLKIGAGNFNTGLGELYINNGKDEALQVGMFIKHVSQSGSLDKQQYSNQQASVFGKSILDKFSVSGKLTYDRRSTFLYGFNPLLPPPSTLSPPKQRYNIFDLEGELVNNTTEDLNQFNYAVKLNGYLFNNYYSAREKSVALSGYVNKAFNKFNLGVATSVDLTGTKDSLSLTNNILRVNPYAKFKGNGFVLNVGLNFVQEFGTFSRLNLLPAVSVEIPIAPEYAILFGGISGDVIKTNFRDLSNENPYLNDRLEIKNAIEKMNFYGGVKGNAGSGLGFKAMASYKTIENLPLFVNNTTNVNRFDLIYDGGSSHILGLDGELNLRASDVLTLTGKVQFTNYNLATEHEAWFKPGLKLSSNVNAQITKKIMLNAEILFSGDSYAKSPSLQSETIVIDGFADLSAGAEYRFNKKIGLYLNANNIFAKSYQQYLYYPKLGFNVFGGFNFSF
ncbi:MAG: hypothetical protein JWN56_330 [Sphingobacteriales bacterium]|nr:hypothetical protein [Sphingobacteriales bacterium]